VELRKDEIVAVVPNAVSAGRLYLDARGAFADVGEVILRDRQLLAETGMLVCFCVLDHKSGEVVRGPELFGKGVAGLDESRLAQARQAALEALAELAPAQRTDHGIVEGPCAARYARCGRRPGEAADGAAVVLEM